MKPPARPEDRNEQSAALLRTGRTAISSGAISPTITKTAFILLLFFAVSAYWKTDKEFPNTERRPVTDEYHGVKVSDDYRWLDNFDNPSVRKWNEEQNAYSRKYFDGIPSLKPIRDRLKDLSIRRSMVYSSLVHRRRFFALKSQPPRNQPFLVVFDSLATMRMERVVVDPNQLSPAGTIAIDWFVPSRDGHLIAVSLSERGSEDGSAHVFEVATGKELPDVVPRVQYPTGSGSLEWDRDGTGFYYTRYPQGNERPGGDSNFYQQVYFHTLGTPPSEDRYVIGREFPRIAETKLSSSDDGRYILAKVANGDGGEFMHYLLGPAGQWVQLTHFSDKITSAAFGADGILYLLSRYDASRGKILTVPLDQPALAEAKILVPESNVSIAEFLPAKKYVYIVDMVGGPSRIRTLDLSSGSETIVPLQQLASVGGLVLLDNDELLFRSQTYLDPQTWLRYYPGGGTLTRTDLSSASVVDFSDCEVVREYATSKDGTKIPMSIIRPKGTILNSENPVVLTGYGGYGISQVPQFNSRRRIWLEQGGVMVVAHVRGGGEFGEEWHDQGKLTRKQNVFDDFVACAEYLIAARYTNPSKLAIEGGSNGGLLMGAVLTQHPELFRAVVSRVGIYDMLRVELFPNGAFNVTEFGTVKDRVQFQALYAYSPYHHVEDGKAYPAVLFQTGDNDGRVDPANSRKMVARLQAATGSNLPILLRTDSNAGHGIGSGLSTRIAQDADIFAFLFDQLGLEYKILGGR